MEAAMPQEWSDIIIASLNSAERHHYVGYSVARLAAEAGREPADFVFDLLVAERGQVAIVSFNQSEENLRDLLTHGLAIVISDGFYVKGRPHPRLYGTFPFLLGTIVRERCWLTLEEAVHRVTGKPAERFRLNERGRIERGYRADLVVFDAESIGSPATYDDPTALPTGIKLVLREGWPVAAEQECSARRT
jgi:dihydroorotase/N-acyl-D-amino-acid deacylase